MLEIGSNSTGIWNEKSGRDWQVLEPSEVESGVFGYHKENGEK